VNLGEHKVTHDHRAILHRFEAEPSAERQGGLDCDAVERHLQVSAGNAVAVDSALHRGRFAKRRIDFGPVSLSCMCLSGDQKR
jgi:hypothetical protein